MGLMPEGTTGLKNSLQGMTFFFYEVPKIQVQMGMS